jgi:hypothetical protein
MSVYSTKDITREEAISQIRMEQARRKSLEQLSDNELEDLMFEYFGEERLEKYHIE